MRPDPDHEGAPDLIQLVLSHPRVLPGSPAWDLALKLRDAWAAGRDVETLELLVELEAQLEQLGLVESCCRCSGGLPED